MTTLDSAIAEDLSVAERLAFAIECGGGTMALAGESIELFLPEDLAHLVPELKQHKPEIVALLHHRGGRVAAFAACPKCGSFYLWRQNNIGPWECQSCGDGGIPEAEARKAGARKARQWQEAHA